MRGWRLRVSYAHQGCGVGASGAALALHLGMLGAALGAMVEIDTPSPMTMRLSEPATQGIMPVTPGGSSMP